MEYERTERPSTASNGYREEDRKALFAQAVEMLVRCMGLRDVGRDRAHVLDCAAGDAFSHVQTHGADRALEPYVSAHDELTAVTLEYVERAHVGAENGRDPSRAFIEQGAERHRPRRERDEVQHPVEPRIPPTVDLLLRHVAS